MMEAPEEGSRSDIGRSARQERSIIFHLLNRGKREALTPMPCGDGQLCSVPVFSAQLQQQHDKNKERQSVVQRNSRVRLSKTSEEAQRGWCCNLDKQKLNRPPPPSFLRSYKETKRRLPNEIAPLPS